MPSSMDKEKFSRKQSFSMNRKENIRGNFVASEKLQKFFEAWLFDDKVKQKVKIAMGARRPIQIRNALKKILPTNFTKNCINRILITFVRDIILCINFIFRHFTTQI